MVLGSTGKCWNVVEEWHSCQMELILSRRRSFFIYACIYGVVT